MELKPYKFQVVPVVQEIDEDGEVVAERTLAHQGQPFVFFGVDQLHEWLDGFGDELRQVASSVESNGKASVG